MAKRVRNNDVVATPWFIRLALYVLVAIAGLIGVWKGWVDQATVDSWLQQIGSLAALIGGVFASLNVNRDKKVEDTQPAPNPVEVRPTPAPAPSPSGGVSLDKLRDMIAQNTGR